MSDNSAPDSEKVSPGRELERGSSGKVKSIFKVGTAHQPNYLPWIGLFSKIRQADCFIFADTFELGDQSFFNRNKIRTNDKWGYVTVPIGSRFRKKKLNEIAMPQDKTWRREHWKKIYANYISAAFFKDYKDAFEDLYNREFEFLGDLNMEITRFLLRCFNINVAVYKASDLNIDTHQPPTEFITGMMECVGAGTYLSGPSGRDYLDLAKFPACNLKLKFFKFVHPVYPQRYSGFESNMSAIDLLFNMGPASADIISRSGSMEDCKESTTGALTLLPV